MAVLLCTTMYTALYFGSTAVHNAAAYPLPPPSTQRVFATAADVRSSHTQTSTIWQSRCTNIKRDTCAIGRWAGSRMIVTPKIESRRSRQPHPISAPGVIRQRPAVHVGERRPLSDRSRHIDGALPPRRAASASGPCDLRACAGRTGAGRELRRCRTAAERVPRHAARIVVAHRAPVAVVAIVADDREEKVGLAAPLGHVERACGTRAVVHGDQQHRSRSPHWELGAALRGCGRAPPHALASLRSSTVWCTCIRHDAHAHAHVHTYDT